MLKLRRATVLRAGPLDGPEQSLDVQLTRGDAHRPAIADVGLVGPCETGDEVIVNTEALDLGLGSGGFDVVHVNLTRGLQGEGVRGAHVMKLNYTSLQHAVHPIEAGQHALVDIPLRTPVAVLALHGQLAPLAWAFAQAAPERRLGFIQTAGGALPGGHSHTVRRLREDGLLAGHITAGASYGGQAEALTTAGALHHAAASLRWDVAVCGPGPGIVGSNSVLGHGGVHALESAHTALALGAPALIVPRMSNADSRPRHRGISHHTLTVLRLLLAPVCVALPQAGAASVALRPGAAPKALSDAGRAEPPAQPEPRLDRHDWRTLPADLEGYAASGLPSVSMGRALGEDPVFFAAALAGGRALAEMC